MHPLVLVGLGVGVGLGLGNQVAISTRGCIIWQGCRFRHNTGIKLIASLQQNDVMPHALLFLCGVKRSNSVPPHNYRCVKKL